MGITGGREPGETDGAFGMMLGFMEFLGRDGARLAYQETGEVRGRPLILFHGYLSSAASWIEPGIAGRLAERGYWVIIPDMRGHGDSAKPHDAACYPPDVLADDGLALVSHLGLTDYDIAGYSLGGQTAIRLLARGAAPRRAVAGGLGLDVMLHRTERNQAYRRALTGCGPFEPGSPEQGISDAVNSSDGDPVALLGVLNSLVDTTLTELAAIAVPTLVATSAADRHNQTARALAGALPHGQYAELPGDHFTAFTSPEFEDALTTFLTE